MDLFVAMDPEHSRIDFEGVQKFFLESSLKFQSKTSHRLEIVSSARPLPPSKLLDLSPALDSAEAGTMRFKTK